MNSKNSNYPLHTTNGLLQINTTLGKRKTSSDCIYATPLLEKRNSHYDIAVALHTAIQSHEFSLVYQPIIDPHNHKIWGAEALLRWENAPNNMGPGEFIKIAEETGIIHEISKWVIENAILQIKKWEKAGIISQITVNISFEDLMDDSLIMFTQDRLKASGVAPSLLGFELTENVFPNRENQVRNLLEHIQAIGIKIYIDDFGTGYNSLIHLVTLPISYLKIDKLFLDQIDQDNYNAVIRETIRLAHILGVEVIAEGVENEEQMRQLLDMECDNIQGYYFSRPLNEYQYADFYEAYSVKEKI